MSDCYADHTIKSCCARFYQSDLARILLGESFHPGGLALTQYMGSVMGLNPVDDVLDIACGSGLSALHLAERLGCRVTGLDYGAENIAAATESAIVRGLEHRVSFRQGDAEHLPFEDDTFSAVISECSFCTFPDKGTSAREMARVIRSGGRLGLTDVTVDGPLPEDLQNLISWVACVAGASSAADYVAILTGAGFGDFHVEDQCGALMEMVADVRRRLLGVELAVKLGKLVCGGIDVGEGKRLAARAVEMIQKGAVGYTLITAVKQ